MEFLFDILDTFGIASIPVVIGVILSSLILWRVAERNAKPGTEISVLWGLVKYSKKDGKQLIPVRTASGEGVPKESNVTTEIQTEALNLLSVVGSTPCGFWLTSESIVSSSESLLSMSKQIKPENIAEALAHLALGLSVFGKSKDARFISENSLSVAADAHDNFRSYTYSKMAEKFLDADLMPYARQAAEQALRVSHTSKHMDNYRHLMNIYARAVSPEKALAASRTIQDPKSKNEAFEGVISFYVEEGMNKEAGYAIDEALTISEQIGKPSDRAHAYYERAREYMRIKHYTEAANVASLAINETKRINPQELFGELAIKSISNDMAFLQIHPLETLRMAEQKRNPYILTYLAKFMPKCGQETVQLAKSAALIATQFHLPDALAEAAHMLDEAGLPKDAQQTARKTMEMALNATDRKFRDTPLQRVSEILSRNGDYEGALSAAAGISTPKYSLEAITRVCISSFAKTGNVSRKAADYLSRLNTASATMKDKDRSAAMMQLATGWAFLENLQEAYQTAKQSPFSGHRLSAYAVIMLVYHLQILSEAEMGKINNSRGDMFEKLLLPLLGWNIAD